MIKANELRVGNWIVDHEAGGYFQIEEIYKDSYGTYSASYRNRSIRCTIDALEEIPLTEEWLVKFGFDSFSECGRKTGTFGHLKINGIYFDLNNKKLIFIDKGWSQSVCFEKSIEYVHQLQNLYFALRGEELTITH